MRAASRECTGVGEPARSPQPSRSPHQGRWYAVPENGGELADVGEHPLRDHLPGFSRDEAAHFPKVNSVYAENRSTAGGLPW